VLAPPMASIVVGLSLLTTAILYGDSLVVDNYSQAGRALHKDDARERAAVSMGLDGMLVVDREAGLVTINLQGLDDMPETLQLLFSHPTHADRDVTLTLERDSTGLYRADARRPVEGRQYVRLEPGDGRWLLAKELGQSADELSLSPRTRSQ
jgi:uncharacterized protein